MAKIITTDFRAIHDALNRVIIAEVKAALRLLPNNKLKDISSNGGTPLCHIIVSPNNDFCPFHVRVHAVWLDENGILYVNGNIDNGETVVYSEEYADWLDITDFQYLIEQIKEQLPDGTHNLLASHGTEISEVLTKSKLCY